MLTAKELRKKYTEFFVARGHTPVPSDTLRPRHRLAPLFTNAGMVQFFPYFLGEEPPPWPRATSIQKCVRIMGKDDDIENIGRTWGHCTFFEMLGNFSFGDYFKPEAIAMAWELVTEVYGLDGDRVWITVHHSDDEAAEIWRDAIGVPGERIQRLGDDNFWGPPGGAVGPCGPSSELNYDMGATYGDEGGPAEGDPNRYREFWNLVFMQFNRQPDGTLADLPRRNIDTGAGLERKLTVLQGADTLWDTDECRRLVEAAERVSDRNYGEDARADTALRIIADHSRSVSFLILDGMTPSNEERGYVVRRLLRRAVQQAQTLGVDKPVLATLAGAVAEVMGETYPELRRELDHVSDAVDREEASFRRTLRSGLAMLDEELARSPAGAVLPGATVFRLHDTFGFPKDLTREIAAERGVEVDLEGFEAAMTEQRTRARGARGKAVEAGDTDSYRDLLLHHGPTEFVGYAAESAAARVLAVAPGGDGKLEVFLDRTPFYAEAGGQVGDTGVIRTETGTARVLDTTHAVAGLHRHLVEVEGEISEGQDAAAEIDAARRAEIRRNHTGTHLLHWALREVLGDHVRQHGSLVAPDRLRFDFSHHSPVPQEAMAEVERLVNGQVLDNGPVRAYVTSRDHADEIGAIAFFDEKYGEFVRVVEAGARSVELCGGTHVGALGTIGPVKVLAESSIGSNLRRVLAVTGPATIERFVASERTLARAAEVARTTPEDVPSAIERLIERQKALEADLTALLRQDLAGEASSIAGDAEEGVLIARRDGLAPDQLRELAVAVRDRPGIRAAVLIGSPDGERVALVAAVTPESGWMASDLIAEGARIVGGGGGRQPLIALAGGRDPARIDDALASVQRRVAGA